MSGWRRRRFWKDVTTLPEEGGWGIRLDQRGLRTPGRLPLLVPTRSLAEALAQEWRDVDGDIDPNRMPITRMANTALEKVGPKRDEVAAHIASYGETDLLCYRAGEPAELVQRLAQWDALIDWADRTYGARLRVTTGVIPIAQDPEACARLSAPVRACPTFELAPLHDIVSLSGSLVLGLAVATGHLPATEAWRLSRLDEDWQAERWGHDAEAAALAEARKQGFLGAKHFLDLARAKD